MPIGESELRLGLFLSDTDKFFHHSREVSTFVYTAEGVVHLPIECIQPVINSLVFGAGHRVSQPKIIIARMLPGNMMITRVKKNAVPA